MKPVLTKSNIIGAACNFLDQLSIPYSRYYVEEFIKDNKDYPSLSSVSALLNDFNIENVPVRVSVDQLKEVPKPAIAYLESEMGGKFVVINDPIHDNSIRFIDSSVGVVNEPLSKFEQTWKGVLLLGQANAHSGSMANRERMETDKRKKNYQRIVSFLLVLSLISVGILPAFLGIYLILIILKLIGAGASLLLLGKDIGINSKLSESICNMGANSQSVGCDKVSNSKAATVFGLLKMSEIGAAYFVGGFIYLVMALVSNTHVNPLSFMYVLSIFALLYSFFSIFYQIKIVKQICPLCLLVCVVIWGEFTTLILSQTTLTSAFTTLNISVGVISFSLPLIFWLSIKESIHQGVLSTYTRNKLKYFTSSPGALNAILSERTIRFNGELRNRIIINPNQETIITVVLSPFCGACSIAFKEIIWLASQYEDIEFDIILFTADLASNQVVRNVLERKLMSGDKSALEFLEHWYDDSMDSLPVLDYRKEFSNKATEQIEKIIAEWTHWLKNNNIAATPSIYINNTLKPTGIGLREFEPLFRSLREFKTESM